jgi:hypothetical protein
MLMALLNYSVGKRIYAGIVKRKLLHRKNTSTARATGIPMPQFLSRN